MQADLKRTEALLKFHKQRQMEKTQQWSLSPRDKLEILKNQNQNITIQNSLAQTQLKRLDLPGDSFKPISEA
jgi:hypothetical protein